MRMSARRVWAAMSRVRVWQTVTVALPPARFCSIRLATGLPTMFERPTTTTSAPSVRTPARCSSSRMPCGVQGRKQGSPSSILPTFTG